KARKEKKQSRYEARRRDRFDEALRVMGVTDLFEKLPHRAREMARRYRYPRPQFVLDSSAVSHPNAREFELDFKRYLENAAITVGSYKLSINDFFSTCLALRDQYMHFPQAVLQ